MCCDFRFCSSQLNSMCREFHNNCDETENGFNGCCLQGLFMILGMNGGEGFGTG